MNLEFKTLGVRKIGKEEVNSVLASELHEQLGIRKDFTNWMKAQIKRGMFDENFDFVVVWSYAQKGGSSEVDKLVSSGLPNGEKSKQSAFANGWKYDYILSPDTAKEIAMMSQTEKGKEIRKYFINVEKVAVNALGLSKLKHEITLLEIAEDSARQDVITKKIGVAKLLQDMGANFDPIALATGEFKRTLPQDIGNVLGEVMTEIRSDVRAYSATYLLKKFNVAILTPEWSNYLIELGYMETYTHNKKQYKKFTDRTNYYGYNKFASSVRELPFNVVYYEDKFLDLVQLLRNDGYID